jgi:hypothetical protein
MLIHPAAAVHCCAIHIIQATIPKKNSFGFIFPEEKEKIPD